MSIYEFTFLVGLGSLAAGFLGALTGLGGGVVIVPLLAIGFGVDIRYGIGASLVSVIATSSGAAAAYVKAGYSNIRIGMLLEIATTVGALVGAYLALAVSASMVAVIFGIILLVSAYFSGHQGAEPSGAEPTDPVAAWFQLDSTYPTSNGPQNYHVQHVSAGFGLMFGAGVVSGLLGIGSGALKVLAMDQAMRLPFKVSTTTSNFMIGVTAAASAGVYLSRGYIDPGLAAPVMIGVLLGSLLGARVLVTANARLLRPAFAIVIVVAG
jgi:uncharacterized protein